MNDAIMQDAENTRERFYKDIFEILHNYFPLSDFDSNDIVLEKEDLKIIGE